MKIFIVYEGNISKEIGPSRHLIEISTNLAKLGHKTWLFTIVNRNRKVNINNKNLHFIYTTTTRVKLLNSLILSVKLVYYILINNPFLIYHRQRGDSIFTPLICKLFRKKLVTEINGIIEDEMRITGSPTWKIKIAKGIEKISYLLSSKVIAVTPGIRRELHRMFRIPLEKIEVVPNGANINLFKPIKNAKEKLGLDPNYKYIGFVGNLAPWQGVEYLIQAAPEIIKKEPRARFLIVGNGIMRNKLEEMIRKLELENYFIFTGNVEYEKVPLYINSFDVCVAPWIRVRNEKIGLSPLKLYEYLACEKPVVASNVEGVGDFLQKYNIGITVQPDQSKELTSAILKLLQDKDLAEKIGKRGKEIVVKKYSWRSTAKKIEKVCNEVLSN